MSNEFGTWLGGAGGTAQLLFLNGGGVSILSALYTAPAGATITHVRGWRASGGNPTENMSIALFLTNGTTVPGSATPAQSVTINSVGEGVEYGADVSWALTPGGVYALGTEPLQSAANISAATLTSGTIIASNAFSGGWSTATTTNVVMELAADVSIAASGLGLPWERKGALGVMVTM